MSRTSPPAVILPLLYIAVIGCSALPNPFVDPDSVCPSDLPECLAAVPIVSGFGTTLSAEGDVAIITNGAKIIRVSLGDGKFTDFQSGVRATPTDSTISNGTLFWSEESSGSMGGAVVKRHLVSGAAVVVVDSIDGPADVRASATHVYWAEFGSGKIRRQGLEDGARPEDLVAQATPTPFELSGGQLIYGEHVAQTEGRFRLLSKDASSASAPTELWSDEAGGGVGRRGDVNDILVAGGFVFFQAYIDTGTSRGSRLFKIPLSGGTAELLLSTEGTQGIGSMASDGTTVYLVNGSEIVRFPVEGGAITTFTGSGGYRLATAGDSVVWLRHAAGGDPKFVYLLKKVR